MSADSPIVFRWAASSYFGWGIYGLNLMLHWPQPALTAQPINRIVLADVNVALFPNRAEGGTNLIAMECLASGIPTILSANTDHLDLIARTGTFAAWRQRSVVAAASGLRSTADWGESDVEEFVELLEQVYRQRESALSLAAGAAQAMRELSWERQLGELYKTVSPLL